MKALLARMAVVCVLLWLAGKAFAVAVAFWGVEAQCGAARWASFSSTWRAAWPATAWTWRTDP